ncbi:MAG: WG repeat-containing protein, partial [Spirochaetota bacterium]
MRQTARLVLALTLLAVAFSATAEDELFRILVDDRWGFMNADGEVVIEPRFDHAYRFRNGHTVVRQGDFDTGKRAFMDAEGNLITGFTFDRAYHFAGGFATGVINGRWGFIRPDGTTLGSFRYNAIIPFDHGHAGVRVDNGSDLFWGIIDADGREVLPPAYPLLRYAGEGLWWVGMDWSEWALYRPGDPAPRDFSYFTTDGFGDGHAIVRRALADTEVYQVVTPDLTVRYHSTQAVRSFGEDRVLVAGEGGLRYLSLDGEPLNEERYYSGSPFDGGVARVSVGTSWSNQKWGILGADGRYRMPPRYDSLGAFDENGIARYRIGDLFGFVDREGEELT